MNKQPILDPFNPVLPAGIAICDMNKFLGSVLEKVTLTLGGTSFTRSMITLMELKANGKVIWQSTGANIDLSNSYNGGTTDPTILKIDFMDRKMRTTNAWQAAALDLSQASGIASLRLEVTIAGATAPTLVGFADVSSPTNDPNEAGLRWLMLRRHRATFPVAAAGVQIALPVPHLDPSGGGSNFRRVYFYSQFMTALKTVREGVTEHELTALQNATSQKDNFKTPQVNLFVFDPVQDLQMQGRTFDTRPSSGVRSAQMYGTFSAVETITIETEELLPLAAY